MKKDSIIDCLGYILIRIFGPLLRSLPLGLSLFWGRRLGELFYYFDIRHKAIAYVNIKTVFGGKLSPAQISNLTRRFYRSFGQNLVEVLFIPSVNKAHIDKYITLEGREHITEGFKRGKGVILLGAHEGSWELSNVICANLGFPFSLFIRQQKYSRLDKLLNAYRSQRGCKFIQRQNQLRQLIRMLKNNEAVGMTVDQGGKSGTLVNFLGRSASMASGAVRLALKYDVAIIPAFYVRVKGPYVKVIIEPPFQVKKTQDLESDMRDNLQSLVQIFEKYILMYPEEHLWSYKIWKYSKEKNILILSDAKAGHLRQAQAVAQILKDCLADNGMSTHMDTLEIKFKHKFSRLVLTLCSCLAGKYRCQGCLWCLKTFLTPDSYMSLVSKKPDIVISCGSTLAPINYVVSRENLAKSIVIMRPSILSTKRFDLVVMSRHDQPPQRKNVAVIEGALNLMDEDYLKRQGMNLEALVEVNRELVLGLLVGGDTKTFRLSKDLMREVIVQIKRVLEKLDAQILITTSRRTPAAVEQLLKEEFKEYPCCKLLLIANEKNIPGIVAGILALSKIVISSPESISMISEAVKSRKYVLVWEAQNLGRRHRRFLRYFARNRYISLIGAGSLGNKIEEIWLNKPPINILKDNLLVAEAIKKIL